MIAELKIIAGVLVVVGIVLNFVSLRYAPRALLLEDSPQPPRWLRWAAWGTTSLAAVSYIALDFIEGMQL